jgi:hypothetical protein
MKATLYRPCLTLTLLGLLLTAALATGINARHNGVTASAHVAGTMLLQSSLETDDGSAAPDEDDKTASCAQRDPSCPSLKKDVALLQSDDVAPYESKTFAAPNDQYPTEAKH